MRLLLLNPWFWLVLVVGLLVLVGGGYWWGATNASAACGNDAGKQANRAEAAEDARDSAVDAVGERTRAATNAAYNDTRGTADERAQRIRTVVVPGDCRAVDPAIVRELDDARERINAKIRGDLRPGAPQPDPAAAKD